MEWLNRSSDGRILALRKGRASPEVNARIEDSRDEDQGLVSRAAFEAFLRAVV